MKEEYMQNLRIDKPCPMLLNRMDKNGNNFTCKSCKKEIIDFRGQTPQEIAEKLAKNTCGIFHADQLPGQQKMSFFRHTVFYALTVLSFLGFNVSPMNAAPLQQNRPSGQLEINQTPSAGNDDKDKDKKKKKKRGKKRERPTIGTPSF
jgi:hypothetical protein